jgi:hypothetical protein
VLSGDSNLKSGFSTYRAAAVFERAACDVVP